MLIIFAKHNNHSILIETTSNQINQYGGYTNLRPKQFLKKINIIAKDLKYKKKIIFGADHLGPLPWKDFEKNKAIKKGKKLFREVVKAGYKKIHIDTGMKLKNDKFLTKQKIFNRCKSIFDTMNSKSIKNIFFVFGTEVPTAGGENKYDLKNTNINSIKNDIAYYKKLRKNFSLVIEPGLGFTNQKIHKLKMTSCLQKKKISHKKDFTYEAHSCDYQDLSSLKKLLKNNFKFLKVGPELTFNYMNAILKMERIEKLYLKSKLSKIKKIFSREMDINKTFWKNYYFGNKKKIEYLKFNSYLDRSRYYWNKKKVISSLKILEKNINLLNKNLIFKNNKNLIKRFELKKKLKLNKFDFIVYEELVPTFSKFYKSCNLNLKKNL